MSINIGISDNNRKLNSEGLSQLLADSYTLYLKTQNFHWNVKGPMFLTLHQLFETQYLELAIAVDLIAERIRGLGVYAPGSFTEFSKLTVIKEASGAVSSRNMIQQLLESHETLIRSTRTVLASLERTHDEGTVELLTGRVQVHEMAAWKLRSLIED